MANEVIIEEYAGAGTRAPDGRYMPVPGKLITTQVLNIGTRSAKLQDTTQFIRLQSNTTGFWYALGGNTISAAANTAGSRYLPANGFRDIGLGGDAYINTAALA